MAQLWITHLERHERATLWATFAGWMLDGMDAMLYSLALPAITLLWHLSAAQAGSLATAALLVSAFGGWLAGIGADHFGRVRVLQFTIAWFAFFTFLSGFANSFPQLMLLRGLQGLGFGGEWAAGAVLISESIRSEFRGRGAGFVQSGWALGWAVAVGAYLLCFSLMPAPQAWRALFWVGILPALLVLYIRRTVPEPPRTAKPHSLAIFERGRLRITLLASLLAAGAQGGYYAITTWLPLYLRTSRGLSVSGTSGYLAFVIAGSFAGYLVAAQCTDWIGRRSTLVLFAAGSLAAILWFLAAPPQSALFLGSAVGFFSSGIFSPFGSFFAELFPAHARGSGQGFAYNAGRGVGAAFPTLVGVLMAHTSLGAAIAAFATVAYASVFLSAAMLPETRRLGLR